MNATQHEPPAMLHAPSTFPRQWATPDIADVDALVAHVNAEIETLLATPTAQPMRRGEVSLAAVQRMLANVVCQSFHGPTTFALAGANLAMTHPTISDYLIHHAAEETGHWRWAMEDLVALGGSPAASDTTPSKAALAYAGFYYLQACSAPLARMGSAMFLEVLTTRVHELVSGLLPVVPQDHRERAFRFFRSHTTTDVRHSREIVETLRAAALSPRDLGLLAWAATAARQLYEDLYAEPLRQA